VLEHLNQLGIPGRKLLVQELRPGKREKPSDKLIALRADMDVSHKRSKQVEYVSKNDSVMYACGHDAHTASLLGTAHILQSIKISSAAP
jgi:amidohydrolase